MNSRFAWIFVVWAVASASAIAQSSRITVTSKEVWEGCGIQNQMPFWIEVTNNGPSVSGYVTNSEEGINAISYPIEVPAGSTKRVLVQTGQSGPSSFRFVAGFFSAQQKPAPFSFNQGAPVGLISNNPADFSFLNQSGQQNIENSGVFVAGGSTPEDAPDRHFAYKRLSALFLGEGSERLRQPQIDAILHYVRSGGVLVFTGGSAQSAASDPRWRLIVPIQNTTTKNISVSGKMIASRYGEIANGGMELNVPVGEASIRSFGVGLVAYCSIDPFEPSMSRLLERKVLIYRLMHRGHRLGVSSFVNNTIGVDNDNIYTGTPVSTPSYSLQNDPFQIQAPSANSIGLLLIAYIVVVVPINFLILRRIKRLELAWYTTPAISVIFSLVLLSSTSALYSAKSTHRTKAFLCVDPISRLGVHVSKSEIFFPKASSTSIEYPNIDSVLEQNRFPGTDDGFRYVDDGTFIQIPEVNCPNLAFREVSVTGTVANFSGLIASVRKKGENRQITVVNSSSFKLTDVQIRTANGMIEVAKSMDPGQEKTLDIPIGSFSYKGNSQSQNLTGFIEKVPGGFFVEAWMDGVDLGPKFGSTHTGTFTRVATGASVEGSL